MAIVSAAISWTEPGSGGTALTSYDGQYKRNQDPNWTNAFTDRSASSARSFTITGLDDSHRYDFRVRATNSVGDGAWGTLLNQALAVTPTTQEQTFALTNGVRGRTTQTWSLSDSHIARTAIRPAWIAGGGAAYFGRFSLRHTDHLTEQQIEILLSTSSSGGGTGAGPEFTSAFESSGEIEVTVGTNVVRFDFSDIGDTSEPYEGDPTDTAVRNAINAWVTAVAGMSANAYNAATKTIKLIGPA